jgi:adenosylcobinamide-phosphate synthase
MMEHLIAITLALIIDRFIGDPPNWPHPVRWIGQMIAFLEQKWNRGLRRKWKGIGMVWIIITCTWLITWGLVYAVYRIHPAIGMFFEGILIATTIAQKGLADAAMEVFQPLNEGKIEEARKKLSYIVGRDTDDLPEEEVVRGAVETVAENTCDAVTAPLFWAFVGGAPLAMVYRAVNTCDSMVGYKNGRYRDFGWASARLDDVFNWIPSRLTAWVMIIANKPVEGMTRSKVIQVMKRDGRLHPSPNSGWSEAATAGLLGIQLGGMNKYRGVISHRAKMGIPLYPLRRQHILQSVTILKRTVFLYSLVIWIGGILIELAITRF